MTKFILNIILVCIFSFSVTTTIMLYYDKVKPTKYKSIYGNYTGIVYDSTLWNGYTIVDTLLTNEYSVSVRFVKK